jgi:hypothetical protein
MKWRPKQPPSTRLQKALRCTRNLSLRRSCKLNFDCGQELAVSGYDLLEFSSSLEIGPAFSTSLLLVGYHSDLKRQARLRAFLDLVIARLAN